MTKEHWKLLSLLLVLGFMLIPGALSAQTPADAVADVVANSGIFPAGTTVASFTLDGSTCVVDLSMEAITLDFSDEESDLMVEAITDALTPWENITNIVVKAGGKELWEYLPPPGGASSSASTGIGTMSLGEGPASISVMSVGGGGGAGSTTPALTSELAGKHVGLYPSHGAYWHQGYGYWFYSMRTLCGPNPATRPPGWSGSTYQPSDYYYYTKGFQWGSYYEDYRTPQEIRFLRSYLESSGATCYVGRNLDVNAGNFDYNAYGYPNSQWVLPKWTVAAKYHLQEIGAPASVWNEPSLTAESDKDIRARPYWTNYNMLGKWPLTPAEKAAAADPSVWQNWISFHLHTNAAGSGQGRGTETYWYTSTYPYLQAKAQQLAAAMNNGVVNAIRNEYDGHWADAMYPYTGVNPPEWPSGVGNYVGYTHSAVSSRRWADRGVKTSNFGEIREAMCPAVLMEMLFHDDWKFYPDHVFSLDQIFQATAAWGMYEGICAYWGITPKPRLAATVQNVSFPSGYVAPGATVTGTITMRNEGQAWCWGNKWVSGLYIPYTVWKLEATPADQFAPGTKIPIATEPVFYPGENATFDITLTAPSATGEYTTSWQMVNDGAFGGYFGEVASAVIKVDADAPVITITSPAGTLPYGSVSFQFSAVDPLSGVASITADVDGTPVTNGQVVYGLSLGTHILTVTAVDNCGNSSTQVQSFSIMNSVGKTTAGGWIALASKKATCGFVCEYVEGGSAPTGNVTYQDHDINMTVKSNSLVAMGIVGNMAWIYGTCTIDNQPGHWFRIEVTDNGEPGDKDVFKIVLDTGYTASGTLGGGNIVIH